MLVIPALDLRGGRVVRLRQGRFEEETAFADDPVQCARRLDAAGAPLLHVVDLDGARAGEPRSLPLLSAILKAVRCPVQWGGGLRTESDAERALAAGAARLVIGSSLLGDPLLASALASRHRERLVAALDVRGGLVRVSGWLSSSGLSPTEAASRLRSLDLDTALVTDISRDGTMSGPNLDLAAAVREAGIPNVYVSGGIAALSDITACRAAGFAGIILGMALHSGRISLPDALAEGR